MDKDEARAVLTEHLALYRALSYAEIVDRLDTVETAEITASSGARYQIEIQFAWDGEPNADVRVMGSIDDGGWRAFVPLLEDFILSPDGTFVGE